MSFGIMWYQIEFNLKANHFRFSIYC